MTTYTVTADNAAWASAIQNLKAARESTAGNAIEQAGLALLDLHSPDVEGVIEKLMVIWEERVWNDAEDGERLRRIIGDLRRLQLGWDD